MRTPHNICQLAESELHDRTVNGSLPTGAVKNSANNKFAELCLTRFNIFLYASFVLSACFLFTCFLSVFVVSEHFTVTYNNFMTIKHFLT